MNFKVFSFILLLVFLLPVCVVAADANGTTSIKETTDHVSVNVKTNDEFLGVSKYDDVNFDQSESESVLQMSGTQENSNLTLSSQPSLSSENANGGGGKVHR